MNEYEKERATRQKIETEQMLLDFKKDLDEVVKKGYRNARSNTCSKDRMAQSFEIEVDKIWTDLIERYDIIMATGRGSCTATTTNAKEIKKNQDIFKNDILLINVQRLYKDGYTISDIYRYLLEHNNLFNVNFSEQTLRRAIKQYNLKR